ncbi:MAG: GFA family protein [Chakrabartia sp.]
MTHTGHCHCGAIAYEVSGTPQHVALCHCKDCRLSAGAPMVSWAAFAEDELTLTKGSPKTFNSSGSAMRSFCGDCGTGLFYRNEEFLPGIVDIQSATLDDPSALPAGAHIQTAERIDWMATAHELPVFERFPGQ